MRKKKGDCTVVTNNHDVKLETFLQQLFFNLLGDGIETNIAIEKCLL
jgi:hypothetical protein